MYVEVTTSGGNGRFNGASHREVDMLGNRAEAHGPINLQSPHFPQSAFIGLMICVYILGGEGRAMIPHI